MTRKHFIALADYIKPRPGYYLFTRVHIGELAEFLATQNPRFDKERWIGYIYGSNGPNGGKVK